MKNKKHNVFLKKNNRFTRLLVFFALLLSFNFFLSQKQTKALSEFKNIKPDNHSQITSFIKDSIVVNNYPIEKDITFNSNKSSSTDGIIYITKGTILYSEKNTLSVKTDKIKTVKSPTINKQAGKSLKK